MFVLFLFNKDLVNCSKVKYIKAILAFLAVYFMFSKLIYAGLDYAYCTTVNRNPSVHFIYVGLNPQTCGTWNEEAGMLYMNNAIKYNFDFDKADEVTFETLISEIKEQKYLNCLYFKEKFETAWGSNSEIDLVEWSLMDEHPFLRKSTWLSFWSVISQGFWVIMSLLICIGGIYALYEMDEFRIFLYLLIIGFSVLMLFIEVQPRYKCVFYPYLAILASDGINQLKITSKTLVRNIMCGRDKYER